MAEEQVFTFRFEDGTGGGVTPGGAVGVPGAAEGLEVPATPGADVPPGEIPGGVEGGGAVAAVRGGISTGVIAAAAAFVAGALAVKGLVSAIDDTTDRLEEFSPALSAEQAQSEALRTIQAVRQAQEIGPTLAEFQAERAELNRGINDLKVAILKEIVPIATKILQGINQLADIVEGGQKRQVGNPILNLLNQRFLSEENPALLSGLPVDVKLQEIDPLNVDVPNVAPGLGFGQ